MPQVISLNSGGAAAVWDALCALADNEMAVSDGQRAIARKAGVHQCTVAHYIRAFEAEGWVKRDKTSIMDGVSRDVLRIALGTETEEECLRDWSGSKDRHEGRIRTTHRIHCAGCGVTDAIYGMDFGAKVAAEQMPKKFAARGWDVGKRAGEDRCPDCVRKADRMKQTAKVIQMNEAKPVAIPPREPTRADLRKVQDALDAHYPVPERGYADGMSDEALARKIDVPRDWVKRVREQFFGPEHDIDMRRIEAEIESIRRDFKAVEDAALTGVDKVSKRVEALMKTVDGLRAQLRGAA